MEFTELSDLMYGEWEGTNLLRFGPDTPVSTSASKMTVAPVANGKFLGFTYDWSYDGAGQEGLILVGYHKKQRAVTAAWVDSFHMSAKIMNCEGGLRENGEIDFKGFYEAPPDPDWGWRTSIRIDESGKLLIVMFNCSPDGAEELAVKSEYTRQPQS